MRSAHVPTHLLFAPRRAAGGTGRLRRVYVWMVGDISWQYRYTCYTHWAARRATSVTAMHFHAPSACVYVGDELGGVCVWELRGVLAATQRLFATAKGAAAAISCAPAVEAEAEAEGEGEGAADGGGTFFTAVEEEADGVEENEARWRRERASPVLLSPEASTRDGGAVSPSLRKSRSLAEEASEETLEFVFATSGGADAPTPTLRRTWAAHTDMVSSVEVVEGGDGTLVVLTASYDKTARVRSRGLG
jgi:hypothetical protein